VPLWVGTAVQIGQRGQAEAATVAIGELLGVRWGLGRFPGVLGRGEAMRRRKKGTGGEEPSPANQRSEAVQLREEIQVRNQLQLGGRWLSTVELGVARLVVHIYALRPGSTRRGRRGRSAAEGELGGHRKSSMVHGGSDFGAAGSWAQPLRLRRCTGGGRRVREIVLPHGLLRRPRAGRWVAAAKLEFGHGRVEAVLGIHATETSMKSSRASISETSV